MTGDMGKKHEMIKKKATFSFMKNFVSIDNSKTD